MAAHACLADSSVLIPFFRAEAYGRLVWRLIRQDRLRLSSVVALELLQGAKDQDQRRRLRSFFQGLERFGLVVTPVHEDWLRAGELISSYSRRWGEIDSSKHQNDVLIVVTAQRFGLDVLTDNVGHMTTWARLLGPRRRPAVTRPTSA